MGVIGIYRLGHQGEGEAGGAVTKGPVMNGMTSWPKLLLLTRFSKSGYFGSKVFDKLSELSQRYKRVTCKLYRLYISTVKWFTIELRVRMGSFRRPRSIGGGRVKTLRDEIYRTKLRRPSNL